MLPRTVCKRELTRKEALVYLANGRTELLEDFTSRFGRPFSAILFLKENGRHGFEFPPRGGAAEAAAPRAEGEAGAARGTQAAAARAGARCRARRRARRRARAGPQGAQAPRRARGGPPGRETQGRARRAPLPPQARRRFGRVRIPKRGLSPATRCGATAPA